MKILHLKSLPLLLTFTIIMVILDNVYARKLKLLYTIII